ncbi:hypothetical protein COU93_04010, partial [Candidatus Shapirobacteria bacterium CG10_big_fil_rev_8_21_14_0_10_36_6]
ERIYTSLTSLPNSHSSPCFSYQRLQYWLTWEYFTTIGQDMVYWMCMGEELRWQGVVGVGGEEN